MAYHTTISRQIIDIFPRNEFEAIAKCFHAGHKFRSSNRWSQFMVMLIGQLSGWESLRDLVMNVSTQTHKLYHLAFKPCSRATLARVNEKQPASLYETVFHRMLRRCQHFAPKHRFKFYGRLYLLDATVVDLCLPVFPWAKFRTTKGALKIHVGQDGDGYLPQFVHVTDGKAHEITWSKALKLLRGSMAVFDMGFSDYSGFQTLMRNGVYFVTKLKSNAQVTYLQKRSGRKAAGVLEDRAIPLGDIPVPLRLVRYHDQETGKEYRVVTNADHSDVKTIAELYRERLQIELFFEWIKQNQKNKTFLGTTFNAMLTQIWIALIMHLLPAFLKFRTKFGHSMQHILRLLQLSLFKRRNLLELLRHPDIHHIVFLQILSLEKQ